MPHNASAPSIFRLRILTLLFLFRHFWYFCLRTFSVISDISVSMPFSSFLIFPSPYLFCHFQYFHLLAFSVISDISIFVPFLPFPTHFCLCALFRPFQHFWLHTLFRACFENFLFIMYFTFIFPTPFPLHFSFFSDSALPPFHIHLDWGLNGSALRGRYSHKPLTY